MCSGYPGARGPTRVHGFQGLGGNSLHWGEPFLCALEQDFGLLLYGHRGDALALLDASGICFFWEEPRRSPSSCGRSR
jgi:hypothetical protein